MCFTYAAHVVCIHTHIFRQQRRLCFICTNFDFDFLIEKENRIFLLSKYYLLSEQNDFTKRIYHNILDHHHGGMDLSFWHQVY